MQKDSSVLDQHVPRGNKRINFLVFTHFFFLINPPQRAELLRGNYGLVLAGGTKHRYDSGGIYIPTLGLAYSPPVLFPNARPPPIVRERERDSTFSPPLGFDLCFA